MCIPAPFVDAHTRIYMCVHICTYVSVYSHLYTLTCIRRWIHECAFACPFDPWKRQRIRWGGGGDWGFGGLTFFVHTCRLSAGAAAQEENGAYGSGPHLDPGNHRDVQDLSKSRKVQDLFDGQSAAPPSTYMGL